VEEVRQLALKTNGSVASLKIWKGYLTGATAVIMAIVVPMALMIFSTFLEKR
jgi:hypothetical protein